MVFAPGAVIFGHAQGSDLVSYSEPEAAVAVAEQTSPGNFKRGLTIGVLLSLPMWGGIVYLFSILR